MTAKGASASQPRFLRMESILRSFRPVLRDAEDKEAKTQVWLLDRRGGEAQQLTEVLQGVQSFEWSPDSTRLALLIRDPARRN